jgi:hypothetical protein
MWTIPLAALTAGAAMSLAIASPATADPGSFLQQVQPFYQNFSAEQLLSEGFRVCKAQSSGLTSPKSVQMVQNDIGASVPAAGDIVAAAVIYLC